MLPSDRILQQQYRSRNYQLYSDLIHDLLQAEKHDELSSMRTHRQRPIGSAPLTEVHHNSQNIATSSVDLKSKCRTSMVNPSANATGRGVSQRYRFKGVAFPSLRMTRNVTSVGATSILLTMPHSPPFDRSVSEVSW